MRPKRRNDRRVLYRQRNKKKITMWKRRQELCTMALQNNLEKGCSAAWQRVCFGYKMSQVQILSSLSLTISYRISKRSISTDSNWTYSIWRTIHIEYVSMQDVFPSHKIKFFMKRKRSQFSSVERGSPKPDVVGSNPTERDSIYLMSKQSKIT